jgi:hypothetical protein
VNSGATASAVPSVSAARRTFVLPLSIVAAVASAAALSLLNGGLQNAGAPQGVISLETARTLGREHTVMASWGAHQVLILAFSTGLAFFCSAALTIALAVGCARLARRAGGAFPLLSRAGATLAAALWVVGFLWIVEDGLLSLELFGHATSATAFLTWCTAVLKFLALGAGTAYIAGTGAALLLRRKENPAG